MKKWGSPSRIWGSPMKIWESPMKKGGLQQESRGCKDIGDRKSEFVAKNQFPFQQFKYRRREIFNNKNRQALKN